MAGFSLPSFCWDSAWRGGPMKRRSSRCVSVAAHVKSCACLGRFFLDGETWPGFPSSVLVGVDKLGTTVYSITRLSFPWKTNWGGCCCGFLGTRTFPFGALQVGKRGQGRVNPGETSLPSYSGNLCYGRPQPYLILGRSGARVVSRASEGMRGPRSTTNVWLESSPRW